MTDFRCQSLPASGFVMRKRNESGVKKPRVWSMLAKYNQEKYLMFYYNYIVFMQLTFEIADEQTRSICLFGQIIRNAAKERNWLRKMGLLIHDQRVCSFAISKVNCINTSWHYYLLDEYKTDFGKFVIR